MPASRAAQTTACIWARESTARIVPRVNRETDGPWPKGLRAIPLGEFAGSSWHSPLDSGAAGIGGEVGFRVFLAAR